MVTLGEKIENQLKVKNFEEKSCELSSKEIFDGRNTLKRAHSDTMEAEAVQTTQRWRKWSEFEVKRLSTSTPVKKAIRTGSHRMMVEEKYTEVMGGRYRMTWYENHATSLVRDAADDEKELKDRSAPTIRPHCSSARKSLKVNRKIIKHKKIFHIKLYHK